MIPSKDDFLSAACRWHGKHNGIAYQLSWHGRSDYSPHGTWCWYILLSDEQFYPEDWSKLRLERQDREFAGSWRRHWSYENFPDLEAHGGWTFAEMTVHLGRDGKEHEHIKIGCDYSHLWDHENNFPDCRNTVEHDVKSSIDLLVRMFPRQREQCAYCGKFDDSEQFYTARNGARVLKSQQNNFSEEKWDQWLPANDSVTAD